MPSPSQARQDPSQYPLPLNPRVLMILMALAEDRAHGYEIKKRAEAQSGGSIRLDAGSLYRTLAQLEDRGLVREAPDRPVPLEDDTRRRYYELTEPGRTVLRSEVERLAGMVELARANDLLPSAGGSR